MSSSNFALAVVTVILRGLLDRLLTVIQAPVIKTPVIPSSTSVVLISGTIFLLYQQLIKKRRMQLNYHHSNRRHKIIDGRLHKKDSRSSSESRVIQRRTWSPRKFRRRSRTNLLKTAKDSLEMLRGGASSTCSLSTKTGCTGKCLCKDTSVPRTEFKEDTPSVCSMKSETNLEKIEDKTDDPSSDKFQGFGDCDWEERPKMRRNRRTRTTRKTRSGKIYSSYV